MNDTRSRISYGFFTIIIILLGLASRRFGELLPEGVALYSGDILWGLMIYLIVGFLFVKSKPIQIASTAAAFSYFIEFSQLYHTTWIDAIRQTMIGGLVLGYGFLWSDIFCYTVGIAIGLITEVVISKLKRR